MVLLQGIGNTCVYFVKYLLGLQKVSVMLDSSLWTNYTVVGGKTLTCLTTDIHSINYMPL